jgi:hypothetical protein
MTEKVKISTHFSTNIAAGEYKTLMYEAELPSWIVQELREVIEAKQKKHPNDYYKSFVIDVFTYRYAMQIWQDRAKMLEDENFKLRCVKANLIVENQNLIKKLRKYI